MYEEIELKLAFPSAQVKKLRRMPLLKSLKSGRTARRKFVSTYFDTPEFALHQAGMSLRVREMGERKLQTLKAPVPGAIASGLQRSAEYEAEVEKSRPEIGKVDDPRLRRWIKKQGLPRALDPVFTTRIKRTTMPLRLGDSDIELAIDEGSIEGSGRKVPIREVELELKSGRPTRLIELALMLVQGDVDFTLERRTKPARGYALYERPDHSPVKAELLELPDGCCVREAFGLIARNCYDQIHANEAAVLLGEDPEGVHQMRVAVRRLRALLSLFQPVLTSKALDHMKAELRWLQKRLGPLRDWDVFLSGTLPALEAKLPDEDALESVRVAAEDLREKAYRRASAAIGSARYAGLLLRLHLYLADDSRLCGRAPEGVKILDQPITGLAAKLLDKRATKLNKLGSKHRTLSERQLHRLRIEAKKLRYAVEFFGSLYPKSASHAYRAGLVEMQDRLGAINDIVVARGLLTELDEAIRKGGRNATRKIPRTSSLLYDDQAARMADNLKGLNVAWIEHAKLKSFWR